MIINHTSPVPIVGYQEVPFCKILKAILKKNGFHPEPLTGLEPATCSLRVNRSTN